MLNSSKESFVKLEYTVFSKVVILSKIKTDHNVSQTLRTVLGKDNRRAFGFEEVQKICNDLGQACAGFVKENDYSTGLNYFPREKAVITRFIEVLLMVTNPIL